MKIEDVVARACERVPGAVRGALVLLPDGILMAGVGGDSVFDYEPLIRAAGRCLASRGGPPLGSGSDQPFVEYLFVIHDQLVVIQGSRRDARLALVIACTREPNVGFALTATRLAMTEIEAGVDFPAWGL